MNDPVDGGNKQLGIFDCLLIITFVFIILKQAFRSLQSIISPKEKINTLDIVLQ